ncbi:MAG: hypothetical protein Q9166_005176 [cf. Caloplaca sp. 2 TL-2023]
MPSTSLHLRSLGALLIFLITALLLSIHAFTHFRGTDVQKIETNQLSLHVENGTSKFTKSKSVSFGRQDHTIDFLSPLHHHFHVKRAVSQPFECLVEKGKQYWEEGVLPAFDGKSRFPTPYFGSGEEFSALEDSGWTSNEEPKPLKDWWNNAFKATKGKIPKGNVRQIYLDQSEGFDNDYGHHEATSASYRGQYIPQNNAILMYLTLSPHHKVELRGVPAEEIPKQLPRMNQLSDLLWYTWTGVTKDPGSLRYYAVEGISNTVAKPLILEIFRARRGTTKVPWDKRITFDLSSDEGKALFASPNGIAVNWLLIHHAAVLGRREPRVTIFNPGPADNRGDNVCMIWDLIPAGQKGSFGKVEKEPKKKAGSSSGLQTRKAM